MKISKMKEVLSELWKSQWYVKVSMAVVLLTTSVSWSVAPEMMITITCGLTILLCFLIVIIWIIDTF